MTNRTGKREREARNRHKRPIVEIRTQSGAVWEPLKLGRKKSAAVNHRKDGLQFSSWRYLYPSHGMRDGRTGDR